MASVRNALASGPLRSATRRSGLCQNRTLGQKFTVLYLFPSKSEFTSDQGCSASKAELAALRRFPPLPIVESSAIVDS